MFRHERSALAHNIAEVIDGLYRQSAAPRDHDRLIELVKHQVDRAMRMAIHEKLRNERHEDSP